MLPPYFVAFATVVRFHLRRGETRPESDHPAKIYFADF
jgi:hypothetical protein